MCAEVTLAVLNRLNAYRAALHNLSKIAYNRDV